MMGRRWWRVRGRNEIYTYNPIRDVRARTANGAARKAKRGYRGFVAIESVCERDPRGRDCP